MLNVISVKISSADILFNLCKSLSLYGIESEMASGLCNLNRIQGICTTVVLNGKRNFRKFNMYELRGSKHWRAIHRKKLPKELKLVYRTHQIHFIKPICKGQVEVRSYSSSSEFRKESTSLLQGNTISLTSLKGYCIAAYDEHWYLACILEVKHDSNEVNLSFLHPHGPAPSFVFPSPQDVLIIDVSDILISVSPVTKTGRTYTLTKTFSNASRYVPICSIFPDRGDRPVGFEDEKGRVKVIPEMIPDIIVPNLENFPLKPYVSYRVPDVTQSEFTPQDLFYAIYSKKIAEDYKKGLLDEDGNPKEPSEEEELTEEEARLLALKTGSDIFH
ncbi:39S ribosomal protein L41, mitochondrial [Armadillidium nasatum]|uniref:39S ribosomal protein L41, mitochondrial n=1 Tax=Armadillidium nasatum TaxID=96803 RepID=A0A5N5TF21_9CRUS|nr:39S ribosomal protein L41, mitochondrial [Armadillidium nasatum]